MDLLLARCKRGIHDRHMAGVNDHFGGKSVAPGRPRFDGKPVEVADIGIDGVDRGYLRGGGGDEAEIAGKPIGAVVAICVPLLKRAKIGGEIFRPQIMPTNLSLQPR